MSVKIPLKTTLKMLEEVQEAAKRDIQEHGFGTAVTNSHGENKYTRDEKKILNTAKNIEFINNNL